MAYTRHNNRDELVAEFLGSGMTQKAWCEQTGTSIYNLRYWLSRRDRTQAEHSQNPWMHLQVAGECGEAIATDIRIKIGQAEIYVPESIAPKYLLELLRTVAQL